MADCIYLGDPQTYSIRVRCDADGKTKLERAYQCKHKENQRQSGKVGTCLPRHKPGNYVRRLAEIESDTQLCHWCTCCEKFTAEHEPIQP